MSDENVPVNSPQRQVLQNLRAGDWKMAKHLSVPVSDRMIETLAGRGWIERLDEGHKLEIRITAAGSVALRARSTPVTPNWRRTGPTAPKQQK